jgi:hypothetical protein
MGKNRIGDSSGNRSSTGEPDSTETPPPGSPGKAWPEPENLRTDSGFASRASTPSSMKLDDLSGESTTDPENDRSEVPIDIEMFNEEIKVFKKQILYLESILKKIKRLEKLDQSPTSEERKKRNKKKSDEKGGANQESKESLQKDLEQEIVNLRYFGYERDMGFQQWVQSTLLAKKKEENWREKAVEKEKSFFKLETKEATPEPKKSRGIFSHFKKQKKPPIVKNEGLYDALLDSIYDSASFIHFSKDTMPAPPKMGMPGLSQQQVKKRQRRNLHQILNRYQGKNKKQNTLTQFREVTSDLGAEFIQMASRLVAAVEGPKKPSSAVIEALRETLHNHDETPLYNGTLRVDRFANKSPKALLKEWKVREKTLNREVRLKFEELQRCGEPHAIPREVSTKALANYKSFVSTCAMALDPTCTAESKPKGPSP